jgi:translation initiation factor 5B
MEYWGLTSQYLTSELALTEEKTDSPVPPSAPTAADEAEDEAAEDGGPKILSKKEKEKLKKEREKVVKI